MKRWLRRLAAPLFVVLLSSPLAACSSGGTNCVQFPALQKTICV
jgi:hypothetical protein